MHPELFSFGPIAVHTYGFCLAIGVILGSLYISRQCHKLGLPEEKAMDLILRTVISGFVGARLLYIAYELDYFLENPLDVFAIWRGGIIFYGGLIGGVLGFLYYTHRIDFPRRETLDLFVPATALAQGFGRIGCFFNGCCYGSETTCPLGVVFPFSENMLHPVQLYEAAFCFALFFFLSKIYPRIQNRPGFTALLYFLIYPAGRFALEFFRSDMPAFALGLTLGQWMSAGALLCALFLVPKVASQTHGR